MSNIWPPTQTCVKREGRATHRPNTHQDSNRSEARALDYQHGWQQKTNHTVPNQQSSNPRRQPTLLLGLRQTSNPSRPPYRTRRRRRRQHRQPRPELQTMQLKPRRNLRKQQNRSTTTSTQRSTTRKTHFFRRTTHPEQAFTQDNAKWRRTSRAWR